MKPTTTLSRSEEQYLIQEASDYAHYQQLVIQINSERRLFNRESDDWIRLFNQNKTHENLVRLLIVLPPQFRTVRQAFTDLSPKLNDYCIAQHWFATQPALLQKEMAHYYGWSARAKLARKKFDLLMFPTPEVGLYVRYADPAFYQTYLKNCQCPSFTLNDWEYRLAYLPLLSENDFQNQKLGISA